MRSTFAGWDEVTLGRAADLVTGALSLEDELDLRSSVDPRDLEEFELAAGELALLLRTEPIPADSAQRIESAAGQLKYLQKTLVLNFSRPGDTINELDDRIRFGIPAIEDPARQKHVLSQFGLQERLDHLWIYR